jgi:hypothetical protein
LFCVLKIVKPQWPHVILLPWSAIKKPLPHLLQKGLFLSSLPSFISYILWVFLGIFVLRLLFFCFGLFSRRIVGLGFLSLDYSLGLFVSLNNILGLNHESFTRVFVDMSQANSGVGPCLRIDALNPDIVELYLEQNRQIPPDLSPAGRRLLMNLECDFPPTE